jgi:hypothetical protein
MSLGRRTPQSGEKKIIEYSKKLFKSYTGQTHIGSNSRSGNERSLEWSLNENGTLDLLQNE